jgi:uncharacterized cupredoxin-like copper-binding protein
MFRSFSALMLILTAMALILGACGGGDGTQPAPASKTFSVDATEFAFAPNTFTAKVGEAVSFTVTNNGTLEHNFVVFDPSGAELGRVVIPAGRSANVNVTPSAAGTYALVCDIPGHREAGMEGALTVNP